MLGHVVAVGLSEVGEALASVAVSSSFSKIELPRSNLYRAANALSHNDTCKTKILHLPYTDVGNTLLIVAHQ